MLYISFDVLMFCVHNVSYIENLGSFSICAFSPQVISVRIYPNKLPALEDEHADILVLKRLRCNVVTILAWSISKRSTIPARGVLLNSVSNCRRYSCSVNMRQISGNLWWNMQLFRRCAPPEMLFQKFVAYLQNTYFEEHSWLIASKIDVFL